MILVIIFFFFFFFSSRRRHTRWTGDWSSDVCSSDLFGSRPWLHLENVVQPDRGEPGHLDLQAVDALVDQIGRASCRERVQISVVAVSLKKKKKRRDVRKDESEEETK